MSRTLGRVGDRARSLEDRHHHEGTCGDCPHVTIGPSTEGSPNVLVDGLPALRVGDPGVHTSACCGTNTWKAETGAPDILINGLAAHRRYDMTRHCGGVGELIDGSGTVGPGAQVSGAPLALTTACPKTCPRKNTPFCKTVDSGRHLQQAFSYTCSANVMMVLAGVHNTTDALKRGRAEIDYFNYVWFGGLRTLTEVKASKLTDPPLRLPQLRGPTFKDAVPAGYNGANIDKLNATGLKKMMTALSGKEHATLDLAREPTGAELYAAAGKGPVAVGLTNGFEHWITIIGKSGAGMEVHDSWNGMIRLIHPECLPTVDFGDHFGWGAQTEIGLYVYRK